MPRYNSGEEAIWALVALCVALSIGGAVSAARHRAVAPLISECPAAFNRGVYTGGAFLDPFLKCNMGGIIVFALPGGVIGVFLIVYRGR